MSAKRFFVDGARENGDLVEIGGADAHKIAHVLRLQAGDRVEIVDSAANAFAAAIDVVADAVRVRLLEPLAQTVVEEKICVDVAQAVPKAQRMDFVIEKCTELGARGFLPFYSERTAARRVGAEKLGRWERLARSAAQQSGRRRIPHVYAPLAFSELLERFATYRAVLFAWELAAPIPLREHLAAALPATGKVLTVIGPEGGFTHAEAEAAARHGATLLSLGFRILRTDTAAMALLAVIDAFAS